MVDFIDIWHYVSLGVVVVPFLLFAIALFLRIDADIFREGQAAIFLVYLITVATIVKLMLIVEQLHAKGKLLPIRFLLSAYATYCLCIILLVGFSPEMIRGDMMREEFTEYHSQLSVLLFHTCLLALLSCVSFAFKVVQMMNQQGGNTANEDLTSAVNEDHEPTKDVEGDYQVL